MIVEIIKAKETSWWKDLVGQQFVVGPGIYSPKRVWTIYEGQHRNKVIYISDTKVIDTTIHPMQNMPVMFERIR